MRYRGGAFHQTLAIPPRAFRSCGIWLVRTSNLHSAGACAALLKDHSWIDRLSSRVRVLVVDDDDDGRAVMKLSLELDGACVDAAASAPAALDTLATITPDVIVTDIAMPPMDGYAFLARLKGAPAWRDIPVIAVTGISRVDGETTGFAEYLVKPVDPAAVTAAILRVLPSADAAASASP
jgi:CheY-like chemotaxis protein